MKFLSLRVRHLLIAIAACAAFLAVFQYRRGVYDPSFNQLRQVRFGDPAGKVAAIRELMGNEPSGSAVIETLLGALEDADPAVRSVAAQAMADFVYYHAVQKSENEPHAEAVKAALAGALNDRDPAVRVRAASGLSLLGVKSEQSFGILLKAARAAGEPEKPPLFAGDIDDRFRALGDLAYSYRNRPETQAAILDALKDRDRRVRWQGIVALNLYLGGPAPAARDSIAEVLFTRLEDEDDTIRGQAAHTLSRLGRSVASRAVPLLIRNLASPGPATQQWTAIALRGFGLEAEEARPALRALADRSPEGSIRTAAREAFEAIDKASRTFHDQTLPGLIADLRNDDPDTRAAAAEELAEFGTRAQAAIPDLIRARDDPEPTVRRAASAALEKAGAH